MSHCCCLAAERGSVHSDLHTPELRPPAPGAAPAASKREAPAAAPRWLPQGRCHRACAEAKAAGRHHGGHVSPAPGEGSNPADSWRCRCCFCALSPYVAVALAVCISISFSASNLLTAVSSRELCLGQLLLPIWLGHCSREYVQWHLNDLITWFFSCIVGTNLFLNWNIYIFLILLWLPLYSYFNLRILMKVVLKDTKKLNWAPILVSACCLNAPSPLVCSAVCRKMLFSSYMVVFLHLIYLKNFLCTGLS